MKVIDPEFSRLHKKFRCSNLKTEPGDDKLCPFISFASFAPN
jgi:hypothetical protein